MKQKPILTFCILTLGLSWIAQAFFLAQHESMYTSPWWTALIMWIPGLVGMTLAFFRKMSRQEMGFTLPSFKSVAVSYLIPVAGAAFIFAWLLAYQISEFQIPPTALEKYGSIGGVLIKAFVTTPFFGFFQGTFFALGEEIGWRGFLLPFVVKRFPTYWPLVMGGIWASYHYPLILFSDYATSDYPFLSLMIFSVMILYSGTLISEARLRSNSVFPSAIFHGAHNLWWQGIYPAFLVAGPLDSYFGGESGLFGVIFYALAMWMLTKRNPLTFRPQSKKAS